MNRSNVDKRLLVIGYGSIGARHSRLAAEAGADVACVTNRPAVPFPRFASIAQALAERPCDQIVIANATDLHAQTLQELAQAGFAGRLLVEKPLCHRLDKAPALPPAMHVSVAYNLRFHPLVRKLRETLASRPLYSASFYAGQYLPQWRPETDYRSSYSARKEQGGGVLRDLSHEIDLALWLCGRTQSVAAIGGHVSSLDIDSDDVYSILSVNERCPAVAISINYLDRTPKRTITINAQDLTASLDLVNGTLAVDGEMTRCEAERDSTYRAQLQAFFDNDTSTMCSFDEGRDVLRFIVAAESAALNRRWVHL
ncbi:Gfo/Idh/MocA family oxidoreductase [Trinickia violacea]|uniref:Gfo/Idh/MocA family oxidoreductase n=1 Tax=Trinickia violacea TaxID=2571746 RepID=A0A4P8IYG5_9BURK|nr:Gfo/Idh/MocA family oxidoreductase [Trinickia violacea]QCP53486.1 Gfo/Idh/MocA family oxidoreductase [Trinickia violacea]